MWVKPDGSAAGHPQQAGERHWYAHSLEWFPDSRSILLPVVRGAVCQFWKLPLDGHSPVRLPLEFPIEGTYQPLSSLRGSRLVVMVGFFAEDTQRFECSGGRCQPAAFYNSSRSDEELQVSPNGQRVVFVSTRSGSREIWRANSDGSEALQLTSMPDNRVGSPRWSPDGQWIAFDAAQEGATQIYVVAAEGGTQRRLTQRVNCVRPSFSADSKWVYARGPSNFIWRMPIGGGEMQIVTRTPATEAFASSDGRWLYFMAIPRSKGIFRMPAEGGEEKPVVQDPNLMTWSVTPQAIYLGVGPPEAASIVRIDLASEHKQEVFRFLPPTRRFNTAQTLLSVSQDGRMIYAGGPRSDEADIILVDNFR
jgi:dipeptidyl aminopeptidase/acylaminoacyl peptidase